MIGHNNKLPKKNEDYKETISVGGGACAVNIDAN